VTPGASPVLCGRQVSSLVKVGSVEKESERLRESAYATKSASVTTSPPSDMRSCTVCMVKCHELESAQFFSTLVSRGFLGLACKWHHSDVNTQRS
jgi:hypothetical protein